MPETRSAQGALPLRSAYPARDLTHSTGRRAISPDKTTGIPGKRLWPSFLFVQCRTQSALDIFHRPYTLRSKDGGGGAPCLRGRLPGTRPCGPDFPNSGTAAATKPAGKPCRPLRRKPAAGTPARAVPFFFSVTPRPPSVPPPATCSF